MDLVGPVGLVGRESGRGLAVEFHQVELLVVHRRVELVDGLLELLRVEAELFGQPGDRITLFRRLVGRVVDLITCTSAISTTVKHIMFKLYP